VGTTSGEFTVERIKVVEQDETLRMVVSNHGRLSGIIVRGEERELERPQAGMLFFSVEDQDSSLGISNVVVSPERTGIRSQRPAPSPPDDTKRMIVPGSIPEQTE